MLVLCLSALTCVAQASVIPQMSTPTGQASLHPMLKQVMPAVVNIVAQAKGPDSLFQQNSKQKPPTVGKLESKLGSGVIINAQKGYIVTNAHVVHQAENIVVTLASGKKYVGHLVGEDVSTDIALIQIKAQHLKAIMWGNSDQLQVGDFIIAIGSPYGLSQTVTSGIVSALQRTGIGLQNYENFIQTDAPVNPGNSGGALVNLKGQLVGINSAIVTPDGGSVGISLAIPVNMVKVVLKQLIEHGKVKHVFAGVFMQNLTPDLAEAMHTKLTHGAVVTRIIPHTPAASSDLKIGDIITQMNGRSVRSASSLRNYLGIEGFDQTQLTIERAGKIKSIDLKLQSSQSIEQAIESANPFLSGMTLSDIIRQNSTFGMIKGVEILTLKENSLGWRSGLRAGDIIIGINLNETHDLVTLNRLLKANKTKSLLLRVINPLGATEFVLLKAEAAKESQTDKST